MNLTNPDAVEGGDAEGDVLVEIENLEGSAHGDTLAGDDGDNRLSGLGGDDFLFGFEGDDVLAGGAGRDLLNGGDDMDTVSYLDSGRSVFINLASGSAAGGDATGDTFIEIENVEGSAHGGDTLTGDSGANRLYGAGGNDILTGGAGADRLDGGRGIDSAFYDASNAAITVNLATGEASGGHAEGDELVGIENLRGSAHGDTLTGNDRANVISGRGGADRLAGGGGEDTLSYVGSSSAVTVSLWAGTASGGHAGGDSFNGFENLSGSVHNDVLEGDAGDNVLAGGRGADQLTGRAGVGYAGLWVFGCGSDRKPGGGYGLGGVMPRAIRLAGLRTSWGLFTGIR